MLAAKKLESLPDLNKFDVHLWCDYVELLTLFNPDGIISEAELLNRLRERKDVGEEFFTLDDNVSPEITTAEIKDKERERVRTLFEHLTFRKHLFGNFYPFDLDEDVKQCIRNPTFADEQKLYIFLLLCSSLGFMEGSSRNRLTKDFEAVCATVLSNMLPKLAEVHVFGTSAGSDGRYNGQIFDKIEQLAKDLGEKVTVERDMYPETASGDDGLDLVAWIPTEDELNSKLIVFGQCACTTAWVTKQDTSSARHWRQRLTLKASPLNVAFIPFCFRRTDGRWHKEQDIKGTVLVDRKRIISYLADDYALIAQLPTYDLITATISEYESVF